MGAALELSLLDEDFLLLPVNMLELSMSCFVKEELVIFHCADFLEAEGEWTGFSVEACSAVALGDGLTACSAVASSEFAPGLSEPSSVVASPC